MEILGDDEAGLPPPPPRRSPFGEPHAAPSTDPFADALALDEPHPDQAARNGSGAAAAGTPVAHDDADDAPRGRGQLLLDTLAGPEALGIAGLLTAVAGATTTGFSPFVLMFRTEILTGGPGDGSLRSLFAPLVLAFGAVALALGVGAVLRVRPSSPAWVRGVAGAAVILAVLMLVATGWGLWDAETGTQLPTG